MARFRGTNGDDFFGIPDNEGNDKVEGRGGNDTLFGGKGDDEILGGDDDDVLDGGAGDDQVFGDRGDDILEYSVFDNRLPSGPFAKDLYDGGRGYDTLNLRLTLDEFEEFEDELVALERFIERNKDPNDWGSRSPSFTTDFGLTVRNVEELQVFVEGFGKIDPKKPPITLDLDKDKPGNDSFANFVEDDDPVMITGRVDIGVMSSRYIESATVTLESRPDGADESLGVTAAGAALAKSLGVTIVLSEPDGPMGRFVLKFVGAASKYDYETLLESVTYENLSQDPREDLDRHIDVVVSDGKNESNEATSKVDVVAVNDAPVNDVPGKQEILEDTSLTFSRENLNAIAVSDVDADTLEVTLSVNEGRLVLPDSYGSTLVLEGTEDEIDAALDGLLYVPDADFAGFDTLRVVTDDRGQTGLGGPMRDIDEIRIEVVPVNDQPSFVVRGDQTVLEDAGPQIVPGFAVADPGGGPDEADQTFMYLIQVDNPDLFTSTGQPAIDPLGTLRYTPAANEVGTATITAIVMDSGGTENGGVDKSGPQSFDITVLPVNDEPIVVLQGDLALLEDSPTQGIPGFATAIPGGGDDEADQTFRYTVTTDQTVLFAAAPAIDPEGRLTFTPAPDAAGLATMTVTATDSDGATSDPETFRIRLNPVNDAPTFATQGDVVVEEDEGSETVRFFAVADAGGGEDERDQTFTYTLEVSNPDLFAEGPEIDAVGTLRYEIQDDLVGESTVRVKVTDSGGTADGGQNMSGFQEFTIRSTPVNDRPDVVLSQSPSVLEDSPRQVVMGFATGLPGGGDDERDQTFTYSVTTEQSFLFVEAPSIDPDGNLSFTPAPDAAGVAELLVTVTDSGGTADGGEDTSKPVASTITLIPVNDAPTFTLGANLALAEDSGMVTLPYFAVADPGGGRDESWQSFTYSVAPVDPLIFKVGPSIDMMGTLRFVVQDDFVGGTEVVVSVTDSGGTADGGQNRSGSQAFRIDVNPVNDAPAVTLAGNQSVLEDSPRQEVAGFASSSPGGGPDEAGQSFRYTVTTDRPEFFTEAPAISPDGTLTYTPAPDAAGTTTVTVVVTDDGGTADGGHDTSQPVDFDITLVAVNDAPTFSLAGDEVVNEDSGVRLVPLFAVSDAGGGPDEVGQRFTYTVSPDNPELFALGPMISPSGMLLYVVKPDAVGSSTVTVKVTDSGGTSDGGVNMSGQQTFDVTVNPVNDAPIVSVLGDQIVLEDSDTQIVTGFATASPGGGPDELGQTFTYTATANRADLFASGPSIAPDGTLSYTPAPDAVGTATVTVVVRDDGGTADGGVDTSAPVFFDIVLNPVNDAPTLSLGGDRIVNEDAGALSFPLFARPDPGGGPDEIGQKFSYEVTTERPELFVEGPEIDAAGTLRFVTQQDTVGTANVTVIATDSGGTADGGVNTSSFQVFTITVNPVNDAPTFTLLGDRVAIEDAAPQSIVGFATADPGGGPDESGQTFSYTVSADDPSLFADGPSISTAGALSFTPAPDAVGQTTVRVHVTDSGGTANGGQNTSAEQTFEITLNPVNDRPTFTILGDRISNEDGGKQAWPGFATPSPGGGSDELQQTFSYNVTTDRPDLFLVQPTMDPQGTLTYTTQQDTVGTAVVTVSVTDSGGTADGGEDTSAPQSFMITVNPVNDPPTFRLLGNQIALEDTPQVSVPNFAQANAGGGPDEATQNFFYNVVTNNTALFAVAPTISPSGTLSYTPAPDVNGLASVIVTVTDDGGTANGGMDTSLVKQAFTISVNPVNDRPVLVLGGDQITVEDSRIQVVPTFASAFPGGGSDEANQQVTYQVTTDDRQLFAIAPSIDPFGRLSYQPKPDAVGTATVQVVAVDDGGTADGGNPFSEPGTFFITITPVNDAPLLSLLGDRSVNEDSGAVVVDDFASAFPGGGPDETGQTFTYDVRTDKPGLFAAAPSISPTGALTFTAHPDATGVASVTVEAIDDGGKADGGVNRSLPETFTITINPVNDQPAIALAGDVNDLEDRGARLVQNFATGDPGGGPDEAFQRFSYTVTNDRPELFAIEPAINDQGDLSYTLNPDAVGSATVTVFGTDDGGTSNGGTPTSEPQTFVLTVNPVNDRPSLTVLGTRTVNEDAGLQTVPSFATGLPGGGSDEADQTFTYKVSTNNDALFEVGPQISPEGQLTFTTQRDTVGSADVTVTVTDSGGTADGGIDTSLPVIFTIVVNPVNDPPTFALAGNQVVLEDSGFQTVIGFAVGDPGGGVDERFQKFSYSVTTDNDVLFARAPAISDSGTLTYTPNPDMVGVATVRVVATDNGGTANGGDPVSAEQTFLITVNPVNDQPIFSVMGSQAVDEDAGPQTVIDFATAFAGGGADEAETQTFTYLVNTTNNALFSEGPSISGDGVLTYAPAQDAVGSADVTVRVVDSGGTADGGLDTSDPLTFTIRFDEVNDPPSFGLLGDRSVLEDAGPQALAGFAAGTPGGGPDEAWQSFTYTVTTDNDTLFAAGPQISDQGTLSFQTRPDAVGVATVSVIATDNGGTSNGGDPVSDVQTFRITVDPVDDAPLLAILGDQAVLEDSGPQQVPGFALTHPGGGPDEALQTFQYSVDTAGLELFAEAPSISPDGTLTYTPQRDAFGVTTVTVSATDDGGTANGGVDTSELQTFTISIDPVNDPPRNAVPGVQTPTEDEVFVFSSQNLNAITVSDPDAQVLDLSLSVGAGLLGVTTAGGLEFAARTLTLSATPGELNELLDGLTYTPDPDFFGTDRLAIVTRDHGQTGAGSPGEAIGTVTLSVAPVNDAPFVAMPGAQTAADGSVVFSTANANQITVADADAGATELAATLWVGGGLLRIELGGLTITGDRVSFNATLDDMNAALDGLTYLPTAGTTSDSLAVHVDDLGNGGKGGPLEYTGWVDVYNPSGVGGAAPAAGEEVFLFASEESTAPASDPLPSGDEEVAVADASEPVLDTAVADASEPVLDTAVDDALGLVGIPGLDATADDFGVLS
jgi:hypothetical protein